jgi:hypothetical protein
MNAWKIESTTTSTKPLKMIISEEKADKKRRESFNSIKSYDTENDCTEAETNPETITDQLGYEQIYKSSNDQDDLHIFLSSLHDGVTKKLENNWKLEEKVIRQMDKSYSKQHVIGKTGKFKKHCKLAKYQNKEFRDDPIIETPFNSETNRIDDWFMQCGW